MSKEAMKLALEALKQIDEAMPFPVAKLAQKVIREALAEQPAQQTIHCKHRRENNGVCPHHNLQCGWPNCNQPEQPAQQEPLAWRDHVEQRLLTWRQSFVNKSGDQLALDDFMDKRSLDDLIDFVCSEYTSPPASKPLTLEQVISLWHENEPSPLLFARAIEAAHGIKGEA